MARGCCARTLPALLAHVNLLLAMYSGAALATGARLKWDPSTYVVAREAFPREYRAAAALLPAAAAALLALAHVALAALLAARGRTRATLLYLYALGMSVLVSAEVWLALWLRTQLAGWLASPAARDMAHAVRVMKAHLVPMLDALGNMHALPARIKELMEEAEADAPRNVYCAGGVGVVLLLLQAAAVLLAVLVARAASDPPPPPLPRSHRTSRGFSYTNTNGISPNERTLLKPALR